MTQVFLLTDYGCKSMAGWESSGVFCVLRLNKVVVELRVKLADAVVSFVLPVHAGDFFLLPFLLKWDITES